ncbi:zinc finger protein 222-like [Sabethes cyaneus]|uniref:zinc finger protein 222-like n=1 Tax=Sabethes cyaneus TaxID=53552 RepID=UPI00237DB403|nr:zinc finger protein 222-like [Sabethes cyaneus]
MDIRSFIGNFGISEATPDDAEIAMNNLPASTSVPSSLEELHSAMDIDRELILNDLESAVMPAQPTDYSFVDEFLSNIGRSEATPVSTFTNLPAPDSVPSSTTDLHYDIKGAILDDLESAVMLSQATNYSCLLDGFNISLLDGTPSPSKATSTMVTIPQQIPVAHPAPDIGAHRKPNQRFKKIDYGTNIFCNICGREFGRKGSYTQHMNASHRSMGDRSHKCDICGKRFPSQPKLAAHEKNHNLEFKRFSCTHCTSNGIEKRYKHRKDLERHVAMRHEKQPYACDQCGKGFVRNDHMKQHKQVHKEQGTTVLKRGRRPGKVNTCILLGVEL